jgi:hypothetical protein
MHELIIGLAALALVASCFAIWWVMRRRNPTHQRHRRHRIRPQPIAVVSHHHDGTLHEALANTPISQNGWKKIGLLFPKTPGADPLQLFERYVDRKRSEYMVELHDEVAVPLNYHRYYDLNNGDEVDVPSRQHLGPYRVKLYLSDDLRYRPDFS